MADLEERVNSALHELGKRVAESSVFLNAEKTAERPSPSYKALLDAYEREVQEGGLQELESKPTQILRALESDLHLVDEYIIPGFDAGNDVVVHVRNLYRQNA